MKTKIAFLCVPLLLALSASSVFAQCRTSTVIVGNPVYHNPVVVHKEVFAHEIITPVAIPVAVPVVVPAFTYQYVPPCASAMPQVGYPGGGMPAVAGQGGYNQGYQMPNQGMPQAPQYNGPYQQPAQAPQPVLPGVGGNDKLKELAKLLLEEMRRQDAQEGDDGPPMAVTPGNFQPAPVGSPAPFGQPGVPPATSGGRPNPQSQFAQPAINALARNCAACHTGQGSKGELAIFTQPNVLNPDAPFGTMLKEVESGRMPPKQSNYRPTQDEFQVIQAWLQGR